jgi:hypothetical protein
MIRVDQSKRLREPLRWGRRERTIVAVMLSCVALALVGLSVYGLTSSSHTPRDCIDVVFASTLGGADLKGCGAQAQKICAGGHTFHTIEHELQSACKRAGFPFE